MISNQNVEIGILLACYNGEKYINKQIESLLAQTYVNWKLFIRDDGSTDTTPDIVREYAAKDQRITTIEDDKKNLGSCQNFGLLLNLIGNQFKYIMFCDQDDYWLPSKISNTLAYMLHLEAEQEKEAPLLVHTNFKYVDNNLQEIISKKYFQATKVSKLNFAHLLTQNPAYGCTMMMNKTLTNLVKNIPSQAENHDYWVALVASALGKIIYLNKQTILYRQHSNNISTNHDSSSLYKRLKRIILQKKNFTDIQFKIQMILAFKKIYFNLLPDTKKKILNEYIKFVTGKKVLLLFRNIRNGVRRQTLSQTFLFYVSVLLLRKKVSTEIG